MSLKLEVGKTYERETGERWYVFAYKSTDPFKGTPRACPYFAMSEDGKIETFSEDGRYCTSGRSTLDLIREYVPPIKVKPDEIVACLIEWRKQNTREMWEHMFKAVFGDEA